ncbi:hypothetical protein QBC34DRAFT_306909, partial [Podospora aff. communis PSN243]
LRMASSPPFRFAVGPNKREFTMPSALVAVLSPAFDRVVHSDGFTESQGSHVEMDNVDEGTFVRFIEYAYTGTYANTGTAPTPTSEAPASPETSRQMYPTEHEARGGIVASDAHPSRVHYGDESAAHARPRLRVCRLLRHQGAQGQVLSGAPSRASNLLLHARVFVFADYWGIMGLRALSLHALAQELSGQTLRAKLNWRMQVVELIKYCYDDARPDDLMKLVLLYAASRLHWLWTSPKFIELFADNREFSVTLTSAIVDLEKTLLSGSTA